MSAAAVRCEQEPVHSSGIPSSWVRCGQRPPQVRSPALGQHVLLLQWVWLVLWSSVCFQGRRETTSTLPGGLFLLYRGTGPGQSRDRRTGPSPSAGGQDHLLEQEQGASLDQQSASKAGECSFSLKLTNFPKFMIKF